MLLLISIAGIGWVDYITGPDIGFSLFYLVPVVIAGWRHGILLVILVAGCASFSWFVADYLLEHTAPLITLWNGFTRLTIFVAIGALIFRLRAEHELLMKANTELESFSHSVSHDLRSPLIHIGRYAEMLTKRAEALDDAGKRYLSSISASASDGLRLIDDLLEFAQVGRTQLQGRSVPLAAVVADVQRELAEAAGDRTIRWSIGALPTVQGDAPMLRVVMRNLMENAVKYTSTREEALIEVGSYADDNGAFVIYVRDNGVGFDPQYASKLFGVFQRLHGHDEFKGTGIGLALVRQIVERHGGRVWADGQVDYGATVSISLPKR